MNGFAPLLEGFLAFALTMLALATGVSAIVGAVHHLRRRHARGLRNMVRVLYARQLLPLLDTPTQGNAQPRQSRQTQGDEIEIGGGAFILDTSTPVARVREQLGGPGGSIKAAGASEGGSAAGRKVPDIFHRGEFIYDMTFMPLPFVVEKLETDPDYWRKKLESAERLAGTPWYKAPLHLVRMLRYWVTLRYSLGALKDEEFKERLASSAVGVQLRKQQAWTRLGLASWDELAAHLLKKFQTIGGASSETFARHSRGWSVAVGFLLAFSLNVDSLDLLNSYLTDPTVRQQVIAQSDTIQAQQVPAPVTGGVTTLAPAREGLETATTQLAGTAQSVSRTLEAFTSALGTDESQRFARTVQADLQSMVAQAKEVQTGIGALEEDITETEQRIRGVTQSLTASFPIGWKRFPNCTTGSPDLRCQGQTAAPIQAGAATWSRWSSILLAARAADPEGFNQWFVGVFLTGLLLGLGTPFWVQAVNAAFSLRRWDPRKAEKADAAAGGDAGARATERPTDAARGGNAGAPQGA